MNDAIYIIRKRQLVIPLRRKTFWLSMSIFRHRESASKMIGAIFFAKILACFSAKPVCFKKAALGCWVSFFDEAASCQQPQRCWVFFWWGPKYTKTNLSGDRHRSFPGGFCLFYIGGCYLLPSYIGIIYISFLTFFFEMKFGGWAHVGALLVGPLAFVFVKPL